MNGTVAAPASRNAPCPCGSGLRYKVCHGLLAGPAHSASLDRLAQAREKAQAGEFDAAAKLCDEVLSGDPGHPVALEILALRETEAGQSMAALRTLLRAARGLAEHALPPAAAYGVWTALNSAFLDALGGLDAAVARERRESYRRGLLEARAATTARDIAVILLVRAGTGEDAVAVSLESVLAQSRRPAELLIVEPTGTTMPGSLRARLVGLPFPVRTIAVPAADSIASALDAAVAQTLATFVVALDPPNAFGPDHLETLVDAIADRAALWGFTDCEHFAFGHAGPEALAVRMAAAEATRTVIARADSVGMAFLGQSFAATGLGGVVFARALHAQVGGFRSLPGHEMWDFAVRATWLAEPVHVPRPTYRHAVTAHANELSAVQRDLAQREIFRDYYAGACDTAAASPNAFAPALANWGLAFARRLFQSGHVLMVSLDKLDALADQIASTIADAQPAKLTPGINLLGFAFGEFGLGENLRALARACEAGGIPFVVKDVELHLATRQADRSIVHHLSDDLRHRLSLMCLNPDFLKPVRALLERTRDAGGRNVGYWYWELETVPRTWEPAYALVDEIWCATDFVAAAIRRATAQTVIKIPPPMEVALARPCARAEFGLRDGPFLFLFTFDYNSFVKRKNPEAVIAAFKAAFPRGRDDVGLVVKSVNGVHRPERVAAITALIGDDSRIVHLDRFLSRDEAYALTAATDAYVSLHRAEGLGLGLAEAMALGRPAIGTGYSGNLEFMNEGNSLLVDYRIIPVAPGEYLVDDARFVWADPDIESAARHMRSLADDPALRARLAAAGQQTLRNEFTREHTARRLRQRLLELGMLDPTAMKPGARTRAGDSIAAKSPPSAADLAPEQRFDPRTHAFLDDNLPEPTLASPTSQLCTASQFGEPLYRDWCRVLHEVPTLHRKQWEFVYILRVLELAGCLAPGRRGLGFGCGREPLVAAMAMRGCEVVATDLDLGSAAGQGWIETGQHSRTLDDLNDRGICAPERFRERVTFRSQDMNRIDTDLTGFDFVWSSCAFEHLGSIRHGLEFVENAMRCLRPGGIAVHTTEFNLSSNGPTLESPTLSVFRRRDIEGLVHALESEGHRVRPLNLQPGAGPVDRYVDVPPYRAEPHLKLRLSRFVITSLGLVIERSAA